MNKKDDKESKPCGCIGGCLLSGNFLGADAEELPDGVECFLKAISKINRGSDGNSN